MRRWGSVYQCDVQKMHSLHRHRACSKWRHGKYMYVEMRYLLCADKLPHSCWQGNCPQNGMLQYDQSCEQRCAPNFIVANVADQPRCVCGGSSGPTLSSPGVTCVPCTTCDDWAYAAWAFVGIASVYTSIYMLKHVRKTIGSCKHMLKKWRRSRAKVFSG